MIAKVTYRIWRSAALLVLGATLLGQTGCTSLLNPIDGIPAHRIPRELLGDPKADWVDVNIARLRQVQPPAYLLDRGDILGVYIEGVLGEKEAAPPVHFPNETSDLPPALGYPVPVREDGTLPLPLIEAVNVKGMTLGQAERAIRDAYTQAKILVAGRERIIVTLMRERQYRIMVVRQDGQGQGGGTGNIRGRNLAGQGSADQSAQNQIVMLPAYKNDVLHALTMTGGLPGVYAKNEVKIIRGTWEDFARRDAFIQAFYQQFADCDPCNCPPPLPEDPQIIRVPLRLPPGQTLQIQPQDVVLQDGDIVMVESRDREVFYTGGMLPGGEFPLPRDYDLDVLGALSLAGQPVGGLLGGAGGGGGMGGGIGGGLAGLGGVPPGALYILRKTPCDGQMVIKVDLNRAIRDPASRVLIQPEDILILRYKPREELLNFGLGTFFTFGIRQLLQNNN